MATVFIPTMLQKMSGGVKQVDFEAKNVRQVIDGLDQLYPGMKDSLMEEGKIKPSLAVAIDGEVARMACWRGSRTIAKCISSPPLAEGIVLRSSVAPHLSRQGG